ncbi:MAG: CHAT domain-containing protein [Pyrinomonadaceae bacterium]
MKKLEKLINRLLQLDEREDRLGALKAAEELWQYPYEAEITEDQQRDAYISALFYVADYFQFVGRISYNAIAPLKRAYALDDGHFNATTNASAKEAAAYKLGALYENAKCHYSAVHWFRQSLSLARTSPVQENLPLNLDLLARNLETLDLYKEAGQYYDEMLEMLADTSPLADTLQWLVHAAIYQLHHGDQARGEAIMRKLASDNLGGSADSRTGPLPLWFYEALNELGMHYIATGRCEEAIKLARKVKRSDKRPLLHDRMRGLTARAFVQMGQLDRALKELAHVHDVKRPQLRSYQDDSPVESRELWIDTARIHVANHDYELAMAAYATLAYDLGAVITDPHLAPTNRLRFYWLQQMAFVVHEMASVWLAIGDMHTRETLEATVANLLLQLKANLFIALERHKGIRSSSGDALFHANRIYAAAARKVTSNPDDLEAMLELEDGIFQREEIETHLLSGEYPSSPGMAAIFTRDFRELYILGGDTLVLDYSLINYQPPRKGLIGPSMGLRYVGIRLAAGSLQMVDLGEAKSIEALCGPLVQALSRQPAAADDGVSTQNQRHLRPLNAVQFKDEVDLEGLTKSVYDRVVAPFEPLSNVLLFSPDGMLAALPFHALIHEGRYLVEERDIAYCHSLLQRESLYMRHISSMRGSPPPINKIALVLGNPNYAKRNLPSLPGTKIEVTEVAKLLGSQKYKDGRSVYDDVQIHTEAQATASRLLDIAQPSVVHIAAHGTFDEDQTRLFTGRPLTFGGHYRRWQKMGAAPLTELDNALLHSTLILAEDLESDDDPANGSVLTALELASLNLTHCNVVVLSACETGAGVTEYGAGVLGFQYALQACFARAGLLSLWRVLDRETSAFMIDFYQSFLKHNFKAGYQATVRKHCRRDGQRVHPYYWAAFVFLDQEY